MRMPRACSTCAARGERKGEPMARCDTCGNEYAKAFQVTQALETYTFDCFECAIHKLAPVCAHCGCRIIGHGVETRDAYYCCAHCAHEAGVRGVADHAVTAGKPA
jgi:hypothetical protein